MLTQRIVNRLICGAAVVIAALGSASLARADLVITVTDSGGGGTVLTDLSGPPSQAGGNVAGTTVVTTADYRIEFIAGSANQYSAANNTVPPGSEVQSSTVSITALNGSKATLTIVVVGSGFTAPNTPPNIGASSQIGVTSGNNSASSGVSFLSAVSGATPSGPFTTQSTSLPANDSFNNTQKQTITGLTGTFNISQTFTATLNETGDTINYSGTTDLVSLTAPEPGTLYSACVGGLGMIGYGLRRRKAKG